MSKSWAEADEEAYPDFSEPNAPAPSSDSQAQGGDAYDSRGGGAVRDNGGYGGGGDYGRSGGGYGGGGGGGGYDDRRGGSGGGRGREYEQVPVPDAPPFKALVGNLPYSVYEDQIAHLFSSCGPVDDIYLVKDRETGDPKGFGYVTFRDKQGLLQALDMTHLSLGNRNLRVEVAKPQNRRGYGDGGFGSGGFNSGRHGGGGYRQHGGGGRNEYHKGQDRGYERSGGYGHSRGGSGGRDGRGGEVQPGFDSFSSRRRDDRGGRGQDGPVGAGGPDVPAGTEAPPPAERRRLKLAPRTKPAGQAADGQVAPSPASNKKTSIFGGGKAHDEFAYEKAKASRPAAGGRGGSTASTGDSSGGGRGGRGSGAGRGSAGRGGGGRGSPAGRGRGGGRGGDKAGGAPPATPTPAAGTAAKTGGGDADAPPPVPPTSSPPSTTASTSASKEGEDGWKSAKPTGGRASVGKAAAVAATAAVESSASEADKVDNKFAALNVDDEE